MRTPSDRVSLQHRPQSLPLVLVRSVVLSGKSPNKWETPDLARKHIIDELSCPLTEPGPGPHVTLVIPHLARASKRIKTGDGNASVIAPSLRSSHYSSATFLQCLATSILVPLKQTDGSPTTCSCTRAGPRAIIKRPQTCKSLVSATGHLSFETPESDFHMNMSQIKRK